MVISNCEWRKHGENGRGALCAPCLPWKSERLLSVNIPVGEGSSEPGEFWVRGSWDGKKQAWGEELWSVRSFTYSNPQNRPTRHLWFPETQRGQLTCFRSDSESQHKLPNLSVWWTLYHDSLLTSLLSKIFTAGQETSHNFTSCCLADDVLQRVLSLYNNFKLNKALLQKTH